jgi:hypothetical protein
VGQGRQGLGIKGGLIAAPRVSTAWVIRLDFAMSALARKPDQAIGKSDRTRNATELQIAFEIWKAVVRLVRVQDLPLDHPENK